MSISDKISGKLFLIDSGADECVFPASKSDRTLPRSSSLQAANGSEIFTFGKRKLHLSFAPGHRLVHEYWIAEVSRPILGCDFFLSNNLVIDVPRRRLVGTNEVFPTSDEATPVIHGIHCPPEGPYEKILAEFPCLLSQDFRAQVTHKVEHYIPTSGPPLHARPRCLEGEKLEVAKAEFKKMEDPGIIRRSDSPWASPLHVVPKADGGWRPCGDYRRLNTVTEDDRYPLPHIHDFNGKLAGMQVFSVVDLVRGFHQIPMASADVPKTAIITLFGLFEFLRMPFGLKNAAQAFQRLMDGILRGIDFAFVYLDDILIASPDAVSH